MKNFFKNICISKNCRIFAPELTMHTSNSSVYRSGIFYAHLSQHSLLFPSGSRFKALLTCAKCQGSTDFLHFKTFLFPTMHTSKEKCSSAKRANTSTGTKTGLRSRFLIEKNAKNKAYSFILLNGLFSQFYNFCYNNHSSDPHADCLDIILKSDK